MMHSATERWRSLPSVWTPAAAVVAVVVALLSGVISAQDAYGANPIPSAVPPSDQPAYSQLGQPSPPAPSPPAAETTTVPATTTTTTTTTQAPATSPPASTPIISNDINVGQTSATSSPGITPADFGLPPNLNFSSSSGSNSRFDTPAVYGQSPPDRQSHYEPQSPLSGGGDYQQQAQRRTFDFGGGGGGGGLASGLTSILTPIAGAAAAALTAGGGASLLSLPNANIQPTLQKTFVLNLGPHNPPLIVQGNAFQPGASAGATINNHGRGGGGGGGYRAQQRHYQPQPQQQQPAASTQLAQEREGGYVAYPNSPNLPSIAGKLGIANLLSLAKQSGFLENLLIGGPFTFFAPSDEAFAKLPKIFMSRAAERPELMKSLLLYHLVPDTITTRHFTNDLLLPTLNTLKVRINLYQLGYKRIATVNGAVITRPDQYIINGVIHVIDRVLFPAANGSILHIINAPNCQPFDVISTVLAIAGLYDKLSEDGPFTVFLPNTESFGAIPKENRDALLANSTLIREAFLYHIVPGVYYSQGLSDNQWLETLSSFGVPLQVGMVSDAGSRRFDSINGGVRIVKADIPATNGVVHIVDKIITPFQTYLTCLDT